MQETDEATGELGTHIALDHLGLGFLAEVIAAGKMLNSPGGGRQVSSGENINPAAAYKPGISFIPGGRKG